MKFRRFWVKVPLRSENVTAEESATSVVAHVQDKQFLHLYLGDGLGHRVNTARFGARCSTPGMRSKYVGRRHFDPLTDGNFQTSLTLTNAKLLGCRVERSV